MKIQKSSRRGYIRMSDIPTSVLKRLNSGEEQTITLVEILAVDQLKLVKAVFPKLSLHKFIGIIQENWSSADEKVSFTQRFSIISSSIVSAVNSENEIIEVLSKLKSHPSDIIRCYGAMLVGNYSGWELKQKLYWILDFAVDKHSGVRELAWMSLRDSFLNEAKLGLKLLVSWTKSKDPNKRRFATELTRPRGVWCKHSELLKEKPELGLPLLYPLRNDTSRYVQNSVANWLNDASKSKPDFVRKTIEEWLMENNCAETNYIAKRALRTISA